MGLWQAGWAPFGVDINPSRLKRYPFPSIRADVTHPDFLSHHLPEILAIHPPELIIAGPPCQGFSDTASLRGNRPVRPGRNAQSEAHPPANLISFTRSLLRQLEIPWVIENVEGAPLVTPLLLCGSMFGLRVRRHRLFEFSDELIPPTPPACDHSWQDDHKPYITKDGRPSGVIQVFGTSPKGTHLKHPPNREQGETELARVAMGIDWMSARDLSQAIPPAYMRFIGHTILRHRADPPDQVVVVRVRRKRSKRAKT
jgi:DNA (cytosine-5)-methyltransferase 1